MAQRSFSDKTWQLMIDYLSHPDISSWKDDPNQDSIQQFAQVIVESNFIPGKLEGSRTFHRKV